MINQIFPNIQISQRNSYSCLKNDLNEEDEEEIIIEEGKAAQEILIYIEKDINKLNRTNTLWEIQRTESLTGSTLLSNEKYLIRYFGIGLYLSTADHIELNLNVSETSVENEFSFENGGNGLDICYQNECQLK